jgi:hypothetical protein
MHRVLFDDSAARERAAIVETWDDPDYLAVRYERRLGYELGDYFGRFGSSTVTIGDGRGGLDALRLQARGAGHVLPTDICPFLLVRARREGRIAAYAIENAEQLSFTDDSFDFAFMKETFHHLPRPWLGLYEALRVARKAVALVEPQDQAGTPYAWLRRRGRRDIPGEYEAVGNFVYRLSLEEVYRVAQALDLPAVAYRYDNFAAIEGFDFIRDGEWSLRAVRLRAKRAVRRLCAAIGLIRPMMLLTVVFKQMPDGEQAGWLAANGWTLRELERNPHHRLPVDTQVEASRIARPRDTDWRTSGELVG